MPDSLIAIRERREGVIARLSEGFAADVLEVEELERRLDLAHAATTLAELDALVADLGPGTALAVAAQTALAVDDPTRAATRRLRVVFGSIERVGPWAVPRTLDLSVWFGNAELDLREASFGAGVTTIDLGVTMGNLEVILPPGLAIEVDVSSILGNVEERHRMSPDASPDRPLVRFVGTVRLGNLEIFTRLPGESGRDARRRERADRKRLEAARRALPPGR